MIDRDYAKHCVGPGWSKLLDKIYDILPPDAYVVQVKEKFGGIRFYVYGVSEEVLDFIDSIEKESYETCEICGNPGNIRDGSWVTTRCDSCYAKEKLGIVAQW